MGCGSSTAAGGSSPLTKDPEDFHLEHLHFKKMQVPEFDEYLCDEVEPITNQVVDIVNEINSCIDDIKEAAVIVCGGFKVEVELDGAKDHDHVGVSLTKADGTYPTAEEAAKLVADAKVAKADEDMHKAHKALLAATERAYTKLKLDAANNVAADAPIPEIAAFNKAVGDLRTAVGAGYKVTVAHKEAGAGGSSGVRISLVRFRFPNPDSEEYVTEPVSALDVIKTKEAKNLVIAELAVAEAKAGVTKAVKAVEEAGVTVTFELKKKKLQPKLEGGNEESADKKAAVRKAVSTLNSQLFKLKKAARNANGTINIARALVVVFEAMKKKVVKLANTDNVTNIIKVHPSFKCKLPEGEGEPEIDFDWGLEVKLPDFEGKPPLETIMALLPGPAKLVVNAVLETKDRLVALFPEFQPLAEKIQEAAQKAEEVFNEPGEKIKAAYGDNADMMKIAKAVAAATGNLKIVSTEPVKVVKTMKDTVVRLADELTAAATEVKALFA